MLSARDNMLTTMYGEKADYVPLSYTEIQYGGFYVMDAVGTPLKPGPDLFGVTWVYGKEGAMPDPRKHPIESMENWREILPKMPDYSHVDIKALAQKEKEDAGYKQEEKVYAIMDDGGCFMRLTYLCGIQEACIALLEYPDECMDFFEEFTEWKIEYLNKVIDAYNPDFLVYGNDIATARSLFMSRELYQKMLKPFDQRIAEAVIKRGVVFDYHACGKVEPVIGDFIETGARMWQSAQPVNDLNGILEKYSGQITVGGGWDTAGAASYLYPDTDEQVVRDEVRRCLTTYKKPGFILWPCIYNEKGNARKFGDPRVGALVDEWEKYKWF